MLVAVIVDQPSPLPRSGPSRAALPLLIRNHTAAGTARKPPHDQPSGVFAELNEGAIRRFETNPIRRKRQVVSLEGRKHFQNVTRALKTRTCVLKTRPPV